MSNCLSRRHVVGDTGRQRERSPQHRGQDLGGEGGPPAPSPVASLHKDKGMNRVSKAGGWVSVAELLSKAGSGCGPGLGGHPHRAGPLEQSGHRHRVSPGVRGVGGGEDDGKWVTR